MHPAPGPDGRRASGPRARAQVAVRSNQLGVAYFNAAADLGALLLEGGGLEPAAFVPAWKALPDGAEAADALPGVRMPPWAAAAQRLAAANVFTMAHKAVPGARPCAGLARARALAASSREPACGPAGGALMKKCCRATRCGRASPQERRRWRALRRKKRVCKKGLYPQAHARGCAGSGEEVAYLTARAATLPAPTQLLLELRWAPSAPGVRAAVRSERPDVAPLVFGVLRSVLGG